ncbi:MAG: hypothetical protein P1U64_05765 [Alcanivoracaceae bacterium]|nr:hypothetical protein [Alcanivoracaceae bacterium]
MVFEIIALILLGLAYVASALLYTRNVLASRRAAMCLSLAVVALILIIPPYFGLQMTHLRTGELNHPEDTKQASFLVAGHFVVLAMVFEFIETRKRRRR